MNDMILTRKQLTEILEEELHEKIKPFIIPILDRSVEIFAKEGFITNQKLEEIIEQEIIKSKSK